MRRAAVVWLGHETIAGLLRLPEGQRVTGVQADWLRCGVGVVIEGGDLPEVAEAEYPGSVRPAGYVDLELRPKMEALLHRYDPERDGGTPDAFLAMLRAALAGTVDPRIDMPEDLRT